MFERYQPDLEAYVRRARSGPCFVCAVVSRDPDLLPRRRRDRLPQRVSDAVWVFARCVEGAQSAGVGRFHGRGLPRSAAGRSPGGGGGAPGSWGRAGLSFLGSNQGNASVHWHVVPLPPNTPYEEQQFAALMLETAGALKIPEEQKASLAARIGRRIRRSQETDVGN